MEQVQHRVSSPVRSIRLWVLLARVFLPAGAAVLSMLWVVESPAQIRARQGRNNTRVNREAVSNRGRFRERLLIDGGIRSSDRQNLFHSFEEFGLSTHQIATFLADPEIRNILGRVVGGHPSMIDGLIEVSGSDANLYLLNPAGIVFGPNSQLNVSGDFTATTATGIGFGDGWFDVGGDGDYSALVGDPTSFVFAVDEPGAIVNAGTLSVSTGSALTLLGGTVINTGTLTAPGGTITIAAIPGDRLVRIHQAGMLLSLDIATLDEGIPSNTARPAALPFTPLALPQLLTGDEVRSATSVRMNADGTVTLAGSGLGVPTQPGTAIASGRLDTSIQADSIQSGDGGIGPQINVLGDRVALLDATVDASSSATPGLIQVGGGYQGNGPVPNAELTYVDAGTVLRADGVQVDHDSGHAIDGGQIVAWADGTTQFYGTAIARGAGVEGRGGQVEISGSRSLAFDGLVDVSSSDGPDGTVLFDPADIIITDLTPLDDNQLSPNVPNAGDPAGIVLFNDQPTEAFTISSAAIAGLTGTVQLQAHSDIKIESVLQSSTIDTLILQAGRSIQADEPIILTNGSVVARINDERANPSFRAPGDAEFRIDAELNGAIVTTNGDITVDVGTFGGTPIGAVTLSETAILTRNGSISITGVGGTGGDGSNPGIVVDGTLIQALDSGSVTLRGTAGGTSGDISNAGVLITERSVVEASGTADITINGISGNAASNNIGVELEGVLTAGGGDISVIGTSDNQGLGGIDNYGILLEGGTIKNTGLGAVTLDGTVGAGSSGTINNSGIALLAGESGGSVIDIEDGGSVIDVEDGGSAINVESGSSVIEVENGILSLNGRTQARATDNHGIVIRDGSQLIGDRSITLTGDAPADAGIALDNGIIDAGTRATAEVTLTADTLDASVDSQIRGTGQLTIQPLTRNQRIQVGGVEGDRFAPVVTDRLLLSDRDLAALPNGFSQVTIGRTDGSGLVTVDGDVTFDDPTVLRSPTGPGSIDTTGGTINLADNASLSLIANRDVVTGDISAPGRSLSITSLNGRVDTNRGVLDTSAINGGGDIQIDAAQTITLGELSTSSVARDNDERSRLDANNAGNISIASSSGTVRVNGAITAIADAEGNAGNGGRIEIQAADSILTGGSAVLATSTRAEQGNAGDGGPIRLSADNTIRMNTRLESSAIAESFGSSGRGGRIRLSAGRRIVLEEGADSSTAAQQGTGGRGDIRLTADRDIIVNGPLTTSATSAAGLSDRGGAIRIRAGRDITLNGLDTSAEIVSPGGAVNIESTAGTVTLNSDVPITASETRTGGSTTINGAEGVRIALTPTDVNGPSPVLSRVTTGGRRFVVRSENGSVDLRAPEPIAIATEGGRIRLQGTEVTTQNLRLDSSSATGNGGAIALIAADGIVNTGDIDSSGVSGGEIRVQSSEAITTGTIDASGTVGDGGTVLLDPPGDIVVEAINAQGGPEGEGGRVDITTQRFFRATRTVPDNDLAFPFNQPVSIVTTGGLSAGAITIRHGGNGVVPFEVGDANRNGTAGALISGAVQLVPFRSLPETYREGTIGILTRDPLRIDAAVSRQAVRDLDSPDSSPDLPDITTTPPLIYLTTAPSVEMLETAATSEFTDYLGRSATVPEVTLAEAQASLQRIEQDAGIQPAVLYAFFVPASVGVQVSERDGLNALSAMSTDPSQQMRRSGGNHSDGGDSGHLVASLPSSMSILPDWGDRHPHASASTSGSDHWPSQQWNGAIAQAFSNTDPSATDELELILVTPDAVIRRRIGGATRGRVQEVADEFRRQITHPRRSDEYLSPSQSLYQWIVEPLEPQLNEQNINNIAFVMDAGLRSLPIAALHDGQQFLIERYSVGLMPSLSLTDTRYADVRNMNVLAMGAEQFSGLPPLPAVPLELRAITETVWDGMALMNDDFTITNLQGERNDQPYGIVHLATHGEFQSGSPENSYIQFGNQRVQLAELPSLNLNNPPVELLVLSACRTALGDHEAELGFAGLALQAGVKSALGSLWYVSDIGTLAMMTEFYQALQDTTTKTGALRDAQLRLLNGTAEWLDIVQGESTGASDGDVGNLTGEDIQQLRHPYYWSAFTIIGSPW